MLVAVEAGKKTDVAWTGAMNAEIAGYEAAGSPYFHARSADLRDIRDRFFFSSRRRHTRSVSAFLLNRSSDLSKYTVDDVALGVCKTGAEEAGVTEVRTSLSEKKFELWREIKVRNMIKLLSRKPTALRLVNPSAAKIKIFTASAL